MEGLGGLLVLLVVICILSGPVALIVSLVALRKILEIQRHLDERPAPVHPRPVQGMPVVVPQEPKPLKEAVPKPAAEMLPAPMPRPVPVAGSGLEQRIGTRWVLIAGVITVMFAVGFFLKYAYEQHWIGPLGRVLIAGLSGLLALAVGEVTRRRGYDIAAKGVTALGFAILYATVFAAHRWYGLIGSPAAFGLAIVITAGAMLYAVALDEIIIAMLSLIGGYLTPVVLATGQNLPMQLFSYVLVLSAGAVACAYWRKWSPVNLLAFLGTYLLYTGWFERFYRPAVPREARPAQLGVALFWLAVFFFVYLALPLLHTLLRRVKSATQDIVLVLANAAVVFYFLWVILSAGHPAALALCSVGMGAAHLALAGAVLMRCREDSSLWTALLAAGAAFMTLAVPLYFGVYLVAVLWAVEGLLLIVVGLRYRSIAAQVAGAIALALAVGDLVTMLPLHTGPFRPVFNAAFGTWGSVAAIIMICHVLYRFTGDLDADIRWAVTQMLYAAALGLLMGAVSLELWYHSRLNGATAVAGPGFHEQMPLVFAIFLLLFAARPIGPSGPLCPAIAAGLAAVGSAHLIWMYPHFYGRFTLFANVAFARAAALLAAVFAGAWLLRKTDREQQSNMPLALPVALAGIVTLWLVLTEDIWFYYRFRSGMASWRFLAQMYISILWAVYATALMVAGFWRRVRMLRYLALGIFVLLLAKVFLIDTRELETAYRIAGFLATGLALVAVSYLYQYLKKTGFFDTILSEKDKRDGRSSGA